jgi:hypothetical protein
MTRITVRSATSIKPVSAPTTFDGRHGSMKPEDGGDYGRRLEQRATGLTCRNGNLKHSARACSGDPPAAAWRILGGCLLLSPMMPDVGLSSVSP